MASAEALFSRKRATADKQEERQPDGSSGASDLLEMEPSRLRGEVMEEKEDLEVRKSESSVDNGDHSNGGATVLGGGGMGEQGKGGGGTGGQVEGGGGMGGQVEGGTEGEVQSDPAGFFVAFIGDADHIPEKLIAKYGKSAKRLDLSYNRLTTLDGLDRFTSLEELVLDNNDLDDSSLTLPHLPHLHTLTLNKNNLRDTDRLLSILIQSCPSLHYLSLLGNQACPNELLGSGHDDEDYQRYRYYVLFKLPALMFLDSRPVTTAERKEARRVGEFMRVIKPSEDAPEKPKRKAESIPKGYSPLPESADVAGKHRGVFGQCKYVYYGKHSEGNRFIRNHQL